MTHRLGSVQCRHHGVGDAAVDVNQRIAVGLRGLVADRRHRPLDIERSTVVAAHERIRHPVFALLTPGDLGGDHLLQGWISGHLVNRLLGRWLLGIAGGDRREPSVKLHQLSRAQLGQSLAQQHHVNALRGPTEPPIEQRVCGCDPITRRHRFDFALTDLHQGAQGQVRKLSGFNAQISDLLFRPAARIAGNAFLKAGHC
jgi:hypothetical protein